MNRYRVMLPLAAVALAGCASISAPEETAGVAVGVIPSRSVGFYKPALRHKNGQVVLDGWVRRQFGAATTAGSHLDIEYLDASGRELRTEVTTFEPRDLRRGSHKMAHRGYYSLPLSSLPMGTATIQVRAHDGPEH